MHGETAFLLDAHQNSILHSAEKLREVQDMQKC